VDSALFIGEHGPSFLSGYLEAGGRECDAFSAPDHESGRSLIAPDLSRYTTILVKGSRSTRMELFADKIMEEV
jgi:UDP-N-acetylmuramyl pentapeptide synthase